MKKTPLPGVGDPAPRFDLLMLDQASYPPILTEDERQESIYLAFCNDRPVAAAATACAATAAPQRPSGRRFFLTDEDAAAAALAEAAGGLVKPFVPCRFRGRLLDDLDEEFCPPPSAVALPTGEYCSDARTAEDIGSEPVDSPESGRDAAAATVLPTTCDATSATLPSAGATTESPSLIALIKAITPQPGEPCGDCDVDMATLASALPQLSEAELVSLGASAAQGFRFTRLLKATILAEAKTRFAPSGKAGRRKEQQMTWTGFCEAIGEPRGTADALIKAYQVYKTMNPILREAATQAGVDLLKPKVESLLRQKHEEMWQLKEADFSTLANWVADLQVAAGRSSVAAPPTPDKGQPKPCDENPPEETASSGSASHKSGNSQHLPAGPGGKVISFTAVELQRYEEVVTKIRSFPDWDREMIAEPEIVILALEDFAADLEVKHANADSRG